MKFLKKKWQRPGTDLTDYFNFGFNERTWRAYCKKLKQKREEEKSNQVGVVEEDDSDDEGDDIDDHDDKEDSLSGEDPIDPSSSKKRARSQSPDPNTRPTKKMKREETIKTEADPQ